MTTNIALIFDFDDTLAPDSTTALLEAKDQDPVPFWQEDFQSRVQDGYDPTIAALSALLANIGPDSPLGELTRSELEEFGRELSAQCYPGIPALFDDVESIVADYEEVEIDFFIISDGVAAIIETTDIAERCRGVYASRLAYDAAGDPTGIKRPISFTDKTRYLFEINKGISEAQSLENPYLVNEKRDRNERRVPFENMIYIGDGLTDIPCFALVNERGGRVFGVIDERDNGSERLSPKQEAILDLGSPRRAGNLNSPYYSDDGRLGSLIRLTIEGLCTNQTIDELEAL